VEKSASLVCRDRVSMTIPRKSDPGSLHVLQERSTLAACPEKLLKLPRQLAPCASAHGCLAAVVLESARTFGRKPHGHGVRSNSEDSGQGKRVRRAGGRSHEPDSHVFIASCIFLTIEQSVDVVDLGLCGWRNLGHHPILKLPQQFYRGETRAFWIYACSGS